MTYGEATRSLQTAMIDLLGYRKVGAHLGGPSGPWPGKATEREREKLVDEVLRLRAPVVRYAAALIDAAVPSLPVEVGRLAKDPWLEARRLSQAIARVVPTPDDLPGGRLPSVDELAEPHPVPAVEAWRRAAVAAITAKERELDAVGPLSTEQRRAAVLDASLLTLALYQLDRRWAGQAGWKILERHDRPREQTGHDASVLLAARATRSSVAREEQDFTVDTAGHQSPLPRPRNDPAAETVWILDFLARGLQAATPHRDATADTIRSLGRIARHARDIAGGVGDRVETYAGIDRALANVTSGAGSMTVRTVAAEAWSVARTVTELRPVQADRLGQALDRVDAALADVLDHAIRTDLYLGTWRRRVAPDGLVRRAIPYWETITPVNHPALVDLVDQLRPAPPEPVPPVDARNLRTRLERILDGEALDPNSDQRARPVPRTTPSW